MGVGGIHQRGENRLGGSGVVGGGAVGWESCPWRECNQMKSMSVNFPSRGKAFSRGIYSRHDFLSTVRDAPVPLLSGRSAGKSFSTI